MLWAMYSTGGLFNSSNSFIRSCMVSGKRLISDFENKNSIRLKYPITVNFLQKTVFTVFHCVSLCFTVFHCVSLCFTVFH